MGGPGKIPVPHVKHPEEEGGEGNWLVSYADMMTLLVGFFVILLSFSSVDQGKMEEMKKSLTLEFGGVYQIPYGELADHIREQLKKMGLGDQFIIKQTESGIEISFMGAVFFETGSADIKSEGRALLDRLIDTVRAEGQRSPPPPLPPGAAAKADRDPFGFAVTVEGHTDDVPIGSGGLIRSNWELSSLRACRVLEVFGDSGFAKDKLTAVGYGETRPVVPNRDPSGVPIPANRSQNRRVVIKLQKQDPLVPQAAPGAQGAASADPGASAGAQGPAPAEQEGAPAAAQGPAPASDAVTALPAAGAAAEKETSE
jgi:chemotaxis protein MotB